MNQVYVYSHKYDRETLVEDVTYFCIKELLPRFSTLDITIELSSDMRSSLFGAVVALDRREFEMELSDKLSDDDLISTICHEMVHVKQYARNEIPLVGGVNYRTYEEYQNQPHEIEAFALEKILAKKFKINAK